MSYQVLARRWRPQKFEDVVGQGHIVTSIQNSLKEDRVGHAYIFSGTRGIGKTSIARIFAKALRCESRLEDGNACGACRSCEDFNTNSSMNIIEIDGASNNGVDDIRDLISNIQYLPSTGKYKVYIIDEVHMLSTPAFNALLKTLEEPPEHAIFIMATTEPEKLLGTVLSRCQRFDFRHASVQDLVEHIKKIAEKESISFENEALIKELAKLGNGSFRDTLSLLDQVLSFSTERKIDEEVFSRSLGVAKISAIKNIIEGVILGDVQLISTTYRKMISENVSLKNIVKSTLESVFGIISSKDFKDYSRVQDRISEEVFNNVSRAELYWIYEVLAQDFVWSMESVSPEDASEVVLRKVA
ncbi:DNA polymerase III subunit gamma/tau, partial [Bacteriovorax sp. DB6_IX]|uniref:DNA polymerase III subunit gamma/tau n=1 Tax=Bacteriovorax sp. DB6_IX TaxID=1353530 RepID=UPI000389F842